jgi:hypothetical protein
VWHLRAAAPIFIFTPPTDRPPVSSSSVVPVAGSRVAASSFAWVARLVLAPVPSGECQAESSRRARSESDAAMRCIDFGLQRCRTSDGSCHQSLSRPFMNLTGGSTNSDGCMLSRQARLIET